MVYDRSDSQSSESSNRSFLEGIISDDTDISVELDIIYHSNCKIRDIINDDIELKGSSEDSLRNAYQKVYDKYSGLMAAAAAIDSIDMFLGPIQEGLIATGNEFAYSVYKVTKITELAAKTVFALYYVSKTNDKNSAIPMILNETLAAGAPYANVINVFPLYKYLVRRKIRQEAGNEFMDNLNFDAAGSSGLSQQADSYDKSVEGDSDGS